MQEDTVNKFLLLKKQRHSIFLRDSFQALHEAREELCFVKIKNKIIPNDEVEIISPKEQFTAHIEAIYDKNGEVLEVGNTNAEIYIKLSQIPQDCEVAIARTVGIKE